MVRDRAAVFSTCVVDVVRPAIVEDTIAVLVRHGIRATRVEGTTCCGQPAANSGHDREARRVARRTLRALAATSEPIVLPSGSCTAMIRQHWPDLFSGTRDYPTASSIAARTFELTEFLATLPATPTPPPTRPVAYHASCHLTRHLDVRAAPREALRAAGFDVRLPDDGERCCGFGGTFTLEFPGVSAAMADEKLDALAATGAERVTGCDLSCLAHLDTRARARNVKLQFDHVAEIL